MKIFWFLQESTKILLSNRHLFEPIIIGETRRKLSFARLNDLYLVHWDPKFQIVLNHMNQLKYVFYLVTNGWTTVGGLLWFDWMLVGLFLRSIWHQDQSFSWGELRNSCWLRLIDYIIVFVRMYLPLNVA